MKEKVEFTLKFNDLASQSLQKFGTNAENVFSRVNSAVDNLNASNRVLGQSYSILQKRVKEFEKLRKVTQPSVQAAQSVQARALGSGSFVSQGSFSGKGGLASAAAGIMKNVAAKVGSAIGQGIVASINDAFKRQEVQATFSGLAGSKQSGKSLVDELAKFQKDTVLGNEVFASAQTLLESGFKSDEVFDNLKMLGQVSMGSAPKLDKLTRAFSQIRIDGRLTENTLRQLIGAGFNPLEQISGKTGKSVTRLEKHLSQGLITFDQVRQSFKDATSEGGKFENMLDRMAEAPFGKMKLLAGQWDELKVKAGEAYSPLVVQMAELGSAMMPLAESSLKPLVAAVSAAAQWVGRLRESSGEWMGYVNIIKNQMQDILPYYEKTFGTIFGILGGLLELIANSEMLKDRLAAIGAVASFILNRVGDAALILKWLFDNVLTPIFNCIENIYRYVSSVIKTGVAELKKLYDEVVKPIVDEVRQFFGTIKESAAVNVFKSWKLPDLFQRPSADKPWSPTQLLFGTTETKSTNNQYGREVDSGIRTVAPKSVNISIGKFLDSINLTTASLPESTAEVEKTVLNMFNRVLAQGVS